MNIRLRKNLRFLDGEEGGAVSAPDSGEAVETNALGGTVQAPVKENPAWSEYVEKFPEPVRHIARETFSEWDQKVQGQFTTIREKYQPYQQFVDNNVPADRLQAAYGVSQMLENDPQGFTRLLAQELGLSIQEAAAVAAEVSEAQGQEEESTLPPELQAIKDQNDQLMAMFQEQQEREQMAAENARQEAQLNADMDALETRYGKMIPEVKNQVLAEALRLIEQTGQPVTLEQAYDSLNKFVETVRNVPRPGQLAPRVLSGGNAQPLSPPQKSPGKMTGQETRSLVAEMLAREAAAG